MAEGSFPTSQIQRLWDESRIRRLAHEYADAVLIKDAKRLQSLFASDVDHPPYPEFGADWASALPDRWQDWVVTMLHVTTHFIEFDGADAARGRVQCIVQQDHGRGFIDQSVLYEDDYVRRGDEWLFATRRHRLWFGVTRSVNPIDQPASTW